MKLNNRGWGLGIFLVFVLIFVLCLIVAGAHAYKLGLQKEPGIQFGNEDKNNYSKYKELEEEIKRAANDYKNAHYPNISSNDNVFVTFKTLVNNEYISSSEGCTGYVKLVGVTSESVVYFNCPDYISTGYSQDLDK